MSADNYMSVQRHHSGSGFAVVMGFASCDDDEPPAQHENTPRYDTFSEAFDVADKEWTEYGIQNDTGSTFADLMRQELASR